MGRIRSDESRVCIPRARHIGIAVRRLFADLANPPETVVYAVSCDRCHPADRFRGGIASSEYCDSSQSAVPAFRLADFRCVFRYRNAGYTAHRRDGRSRGEISPRKVCTRAFVERPGPLLAVARPSERGAGSQRCRVPDKQFRRGRTYHNGRNESFLPEMRPGPPGTPWIGRLSYRLDIYRERRRQEFLRCGSADDFIGDCERMAPNRPDHRRMVRPESIAGLARNTSVSGGGFTGADGILPQDRHYGNSDGTYRQPTFAGRV